MKTTKQDSGSFVLLLVLFIATLLWWCSAADSFYAYAAATVEEASAVVPLSKEQLAKRAVPVVYDTTVKYRKFFITAPEAKQVELRADFNRWGKDPIVLTPYKKGYFETSVALAGGEYKYLFAIDGVETPDPSNQDRQTLPDGRVICIKTVK